ncbi:256_t:CDS:10 [Paraglomus occultum]|uniref:256_t:CDS:1 n=1 Tax=Paraglomus occultum TaxID=144539 RepID=A0A9N9FCC8_9GLOM|nr:256_t:CDS:10 [Paraglomus occultum]
MRIFDRSRTIISENLEQAVNKAEDDWALIAKICDTVNANDSGAKEAAKFVRKKLVRSQNTPAVQARTITVLRSLADNCGARFHAELASKKFLDNIEQVATASNTDAATKVLLINSLRDLAERFKNEPSLYPISNLYGRIMQKEITITGRVIQNNPTWNNPMAAMTDDIEVAKNAAQVLNQTLAFTDPESEDITKNELIQEFYNKCKQIHQRLGKHLAEVTDEQLINTLITVNQELLNSFKLYDDMVDRRNVGLAKAESKQVTRPNGVEHFYDISEGAGVGPSKPLKYGNSNPFADDNEAIYDPQISGPSEKALGKLPANNSEDDQPSSFTNEHSSGLAVPFSPEYHTSSAMSGQRREDLLIQN